MVVLTPVPFDDRDGRIWLDGALIPRRDARLHVLSHGLHYASAVFEGEWAYRGPLVAGLLDSITQRTVMRLAAGTAWT